MAMSAARPTRRFFQFSITSLLLLTALVAIWLAWELAFIRERQAWLRTNGALLVDSDLIANSALAHIPVWRILLGDTPVTAIQEPNEWPNAERAYAAELFPEVQLWKASLPMNGIWLRSLRMSRDLAQEQAAPDPTPSAREQRRKLWNQGFAR